MTSAAQKQREYMRAYRAKHPEKWAAYRANNRKALAEKARAYRQNNGEAITQRDVARRRLKRATDTKFAITHRVRARIAHAYRGSLKPAATQKLIGCTFAEFVAHIEAAFQPGMTWANRGEWHIDHIRPVSSFDLSDAEQAKQAFHYTNCQPLWAIDNLRKGDRVEPA